MPKEIRNALTHQRVTREKRPGYHCDGGGLYLAVSEHGSRCWIFRATVNGRRREIGMGSAYTLGLADARKLAADWRAIARAGGDPAAVRDAGKRETITFEDAARRVYREQIEGHGRNGKHRLQWITTLATYAFPTIGAKPVHTIEQRDVLAVLAPIWITTPETARRVRQRLRTVLDWSRAAGFRDGVNPVEGVEKGLPRQREKAGHFAALPYADVPAVMKRIEGVDGMGALALRCAILTAARSGEVRGATWAEFDLDEGVWTVPAERMKAGREHRVPLSPAALAIPSARYGKPLSDMTLAAVLKRLEVPVTVHGFRSSFRDWAEEATSFPHEVKEAALAHTVRSKVERAYRRTDLFEKRGELMAAWAAFAAGAPDSQTRG
jgi:integrase